MKGGESGAARSSSGIGIGINADGSFFATEVSSPDLTRRHFTEGRLVIPAAMLARGMGAALPETDVILRVLEASPLGRMLRNQAMVIAAGVEATPLDDDDVVLQSMVELIQIILKQALPADAMVVGARESLADRAYQFIERNLADSKLSAQTIAQGIGCSRATLYRLFSQRHTSVAKVVREVRLKRVSELLASTPPDVPIKCIALEVGFPDPPNFARFVRHHFGMPPTLLRYGLAG